MPESPDFDQMARDLLDAFIDTRQARPQQIVDYLRHVWNARGAADLAIVVDERLAGVDTEDMERAIKKLDR